MRLLNLLTFLLLLSSAVLAETAINLLPEKGFDGVNVVEVKNITGSCGPAVVEVLGVTGVFRNFYTSDPSTAKITIRTKPGPEGLLTLSNENAQLSDHNGVACVETKGGSRLLIWSGCSGSVCSDEFNFTVIDPSNRAFITEQDSRKAQCDAKCASKLLGNHLPESINNLQPIAAIIGSIVSPPDPDGWVSEAGGCIPNTLNKGKECDFSISVLRKSDSRVLTLEKKVTKAGVKKAKWLMVDQMPYPTISKTELLAISTCELNSKRDVSIFAVVNQAETEWYTEVQQAYRANIKTGKFETIPSTEVRCMNEGWGL